MESNVESKMESNIETNPSNIPYYNVNYPHNIKKIYHISDIHIRLRKRHQEYQEVFNQFYQLLLQEPNKKESIVIITGDILHSKTELLPECIDITRRFFQSLVNIINVIIIAGNHDANLFNKDSMDSLTPLVDKINRPDLSSFKEGELGDLDFPRLFYYLRETGIYQFNNIFFSLISVFDYQMITAQEAQNYLENNQIINTDNCKNKYLKIALFHGGLDGSITDLGTKINNEKKNICLNSFDNYDYVLLGDIHKHQYLNSDKTIAYAGSMIQQNHGETIENHGVLIWDLVKKKSWLQEIENNYGFLTVKIRDGNLVNQSSQIIPKNTRLRIEIISGNNQHLNDFISNFKQKSNLLEILSYRINDPDPYSNLNSNLDPNNNNHKQLAVSEEQLEFNLRNLEHQNQYLENYLINHKKKEISISIDSGKRKDNGEIIYHLTPDPQKIKEIQEYNKEINLLSGYQTENINSNSLWKLKELEFDNLFSFSENNKISFSNSNGILGIVAPNHTGKSSIIDIILYLLFDKFSRKGTIKEIINNQKENFKCQIKIEMGDRLYYIKKYGKKQANDKLPVKINFHSTDLNGKDKISLNGQKPQDTKKIISKYFGTYDDMILTSISLQNNNTLFADSGSTDRKKELEKLIKIEIFEKLKDCANEKYREKTGIINYLSKSDPYQELENLITELLDFQEKSDEIKTKLKSFQKIIQKNQEEISQCQLEYNLNINVTPQEIESIIDQKNKLKSSLDSNIDFRLDLELENLKSENLSFIQKEISSFEKKSKLEINSLETQIQEKHLEIIPINEEISQLISQKKKIHKKTEDLINQKNRILIKLDNDQKRRKKLEIKQKSLQKYESELSTGLAQDLLIQFLQKWIDYKLESLLIDHEFTSKTTSIKWDNIKQSIDSKLISLRNKKRKSSDDKKIISEIEFFLSDLEYWKDQFENYNQKSKSNSNSNSNQSKREIEKLIQEIITEIEELEKKLKEENSDQLSTQLINLELGIKNSQFDLEKLSDKISQKEKNLIIQESISKLKNSKKLLDNQIEKNQNTLAKYQNYFDLTQKIKEFNSNYIIIQKLETLELEKKKIENQKTKLEEEEKTYYGSIDSCNYDIEKTKEKIKDLENRQENILIDKLYLEAVKKIPFIIIDKICPKLESTVNEILSSLVDFTLKFVVDDKDFNVFLVRNQFSVPLSNSSGFEKFVSSIMIRLSLIEISNLPKPNFLAIDEGFGNFDSDNINNVGIIFDYLKTRFDFVIVISHLQQLRGYLDQQIILKKNGDFSEISN